MSELDIHVSPLVEDCFYVLLGIDKKISEQRAMNATRRVLGHTKEEYADALKTARQMIDNMEKYGVACDEWAK